LAPSAIVRGGRERKMGIEIKMAYHQIYRFLVRFERFQSDYPARKESVWVVLETKHDDTDATIEEWEKDAWNALWKQYPIWQCPFNQGNPAKTDFDKLRYKWSSAFLEDVVRI